MRTHGSAFAGAALKALLASAALFLAVPGGAETGAERYARLLKGAWSWSERRVLAEEMRDSGDPAFAAVLGDLLDQALGVERSRLDSLERRHYDAALAAVCYSLGRAKRLESSDALFRLAASQADPFARSEAVIALGRMGAREYAIPIVEILSRANAGISGGTGAGAGVGAGAASGSTDRDAAEKIAYGCVVSLGLMGDIAGWREVFLASQAWYGPTVKKAAEQSLVSMVGDPTEAVLTVIEAEPPGMGELALRHEMSSSADPGGKTRAALAAIGAGRVKDSGGFQERAAAKSLRIAGARALAAIGGSDPSPARSLRDVWTRGDGDERLAVLDALGSNSSNACIDELYAIIEGLDQARRIGNVREDADRMMRAALASAGRLGEAGLEPVVRTVLANSAWSQAVRAAANEALAAMGAR